MEKHTAINSSSKVKGFAQRASSVWYTRLLYFSYTEPNCFVRFIKNALSAAYEMKEGQAYTIVRDQISGTDNPMFDR